VWFVVKNLRNLRKNEKGESIMNPVVCIDGPAGAGKSTVSKALAKRLGFLYVDSGSFYRNVTWHAMQAGVDCANPEAMGAFCDTLTVAFVKKEGSMVCVMNGRELKEEIRTKEVNSNVSPVATAPLVRAKVTGWMRDMRKEGALVVEGRDIGSVVYPDSPARFYLDADPDERARRRHKEEVAKGIGTATNSQEAVKASLLNRDKIDSSRKTAPLKIPEGAIVIDTTPLTIEQVVEAIYERLPEEWKH